jgi:hypothetical protein
MLIYLIVKVEPQSLMSLSNKSTGEAAMSLAEADFVPWFEPTRASSINFEAGDGFNKL